MKINLKSRQLLTFIKGIFFLNIFFLAGTYIFNYYYFNIQNGNWQNGSSIKYVLMQFSLATENVLATWYSSMLFLSVGLIFFFCYMLQKKHPTQKSNTSVAYGWLIFSGIFTLLSLDEMASLHERVGNIHALNPLGDYPLGWVFLLAIPIILVACFMVWFCLLQIKRAPMAAIFAVAGILLFGSILVQEYIEINAWKATGRDETWQRPVEYLLVEEGSELFGAMLMMVSGLLFTYYLSAGKKFTPGSSMKLKLQLNKRKTVFHFAAGSLFLALLMLVIVNSDLLILAGDHGKRENWFPAATAFFSSLLCLYLYFKSSQTSSSKVFLYLGFFCILISAYFGGNMYAFMQNATDSLYKITFLTFLIFTTIGLAIKMFTLVKDLYSKVAILLWASLLIPAFVIFSWYSAALIFAGFSFLSVSLLHRITYKIPEISGLPVTGKNTV